MTIRRVRWSRVSLVVLVVLVVSPWQRLEAREATILALRLQVREAQTAAPSRTRGADARALACPGAWLMLERSATNEARVS